MAPKLTAQWTANQYTLTVNSAHGTVTKSPDKATYTYGEEVTLSVTPDAGWTFTGWTPELTGNKVTITGDTSVTANFTALGVGLQDPHGSLTSWNNTFSWTGLAGADWYLVQVQDTADNNILAEVVHGRGSELCG